VTAANIHSPDKKIQMSQSGNLFAAALFILVLAVADTLNGGENLER
jgi:hypothetical protein